MSPSAVRPNETFLSQAEKTSYGSVLKERMKFTIYVHREGIQRNFHHKIVVANQKHGFITLELSMNEKRVVPVCEQFHGEVKELEWKKEVECTFEELAKDAIELLRNMGRYSLISNNCQNFCNSFLDTIEAPQYMTTAKQAAIIGAGIGIGLLGAVVLIMTWTFLAGNLRLECAISVILLYIIIWCVVTIFGCNCITNIYTGTFATVLSLSLVLIHRYI